MALMFDASLTDSARAQSLGTGLEPYAALCLSTTVPDAWNVLPALSSCGGLYSSWDTKQFYLLQQGFLPLPPPPPQPHGYKRMEELEDASHSPRTRVLAPE